MITIPAKLTNALKLRQSHEVKVYLVGEVICVQRVDRGGFRPGVVPVRVQAEEAVEEGD